MSNLKMKVTKSVLIVLLIMAAVLSIALGNIGIDTVGIAYAETQSTNMSAENLDSATKNQAIVEGTPSMTIITHGIGGSAADWSNDGSKFAYDARSPLETLKINGNADVYLLKSLGKLTDSYDYEFYPLVGNDYDIYNLEHEIGYYDIEFEMLSKHMIFVFNSYDPLSSIEEQYNELHNIIDSLFYQIVNMGVAHPLINMIGYDIGGLLNVMYANAHPYNVQGIFNYSTPYLGSNLTKIDPLYKYYKYVIPNFEYSEAKASIEAINNGNTDILSNWNQTVSVNPNIKLHNLVGATSFKYIHKTIMSGIDDLLSQVEQIKGVFNGSSEMTFRQLLEMLYNNQFLIANLKSMDATKAYKDYVDAIIYIYEETVFNRVLYIEQKAIIANTIGDNKDLIIDSIDLQATPVVNLLFNLPSISKSGITKAKTIEIIEEKQTQIEKLVETVKPIIGLTKSMPILSQGVVDTATFTTHIIEYFPIT